MASLMRHKSPRLALRASTIPLESSLAPSKLALCISLGHIHLMPFGTDCGLPEVTPCPGCALVGTSATYMHTPQGVPSIPCTWPCLGLKQADTALSRKFSVSGLDGAWYQSSHVCLFMPRGVPCRLPL